MSKTNQSLTVNPSSKTVKVGSISSIMQAFEMQCSAAKSVVWHLPPNAPLRTVATMSEVISKMAISNG